MSPTQVEAITQAGAELRLITLSPKPLPSAQSEVVLPPVVQPDPLIQDMIDQVDAGQVSTYDRQLAGELPVEVGGGSYTITTRQTYSGTPIQKATQYIGERLAADGLDVEYHVWNNTTNPNVIGEYTGLSNPDDIFIIGGHLDDVSGSPGADDNASGSVAALIAADIFSQYEWGCTLRFAFWTGEEQGLLGSDAYAHRSYLLGEHILGYLNLDMIAYNTLATSPGIDLLYSSTKPLTYQLALLYSGVINAYNIGLVPDIRTDLGGGSDHSSFWNHGYTSILAIEDQADFNPRYHQSGDTPANTDLAYFTNFVKASIATYAHMSGCLISNGWLDGHVTEADTGDPLAGVEITVAPPTAGGQVITDPAGYYTMTLPADTYTVTSSLNGYITQSVETSVLYGSGTTQDFVLQPITCTSVTQADFTWLPLDPFTDEIITFTATASGTKPIDFAWDFGDGITATGEIATHAFTEAGSYTIALSAQNACSSPPPVNKVFRILPPRLKLFLPIFVWDQ